MKNRCAADGRFQNKARQVGLGKVSESLTGTLKLLTSWLRFMCCGRFFFFHLYSMDHKSVEYLPSPLMSFCESSAVWTGLQRRWAKRPNSRSFSFHHIIASFLFCFSIPSADEWHRKWLVFLLLFRHRDLMSFFSCLSFLIPILNVYLGQNKAQ